MNTLNALGFFMDYCNKNINRDPYVTEERFQTGMRIIQKSDDKRFSWCKSAKDVLHELNWPNLQ